MTAFLTEPTRKNPEVHFKVLSGNLFFEYELSSDPDNARSLSELLVDRIPDITFSIKRKYHQDGAT